MDSSVAGFRVDPPSVRQYGASAPLALMLCVAFSVIGSSVAYAQAAPAASAPSVSAPDYWLRLDSDLSVPHESLESPWTSLVRKPDAKADYSLASHAQELGLFGAHASSHSAFSLGSSKTLFAPNSMHDVHPQIAFGTGDTLRTLLRAVGVDATCMAPAMRMHSNVAGSGPHTNVSLTARCNVH
jgi:hypothetical protein